MTRSRQAHRDTLQPWPSFERTPTTGDLFGIGCASPYTCYATGDHGTLLALR